MRTAQSMVLWYPAVFFSPLPRLKLTILVATKEQKLILYISQWKQKSCWVILSRETTNKVAGRVSHTLRQKTKRPFFTGFVGTAKI